MPPDLHDHPGYLFVWATLLPLLSFVLILLACGVWAVLRRYRHSEAGERLYELFGGDRGGRGAAYVATAAIGIACLLSLAGFIIYVGGAGNDERERARLEEDVADLHKKAGKLEKPEGPEWAELKDKLDDAEARRARLDGRWAGRFDWLRLSPAGVADPDRGTVLQLGFRIDTLGALMFVMVTFVATLIHIFSIGYMGEELHEPVEDHHVHGEHGGHYKRRGRFGRFFLYMSLFCFSMLNLVLADNLFQVFLSWELVGICSYLLIGFYFERRTASNAANKAFIVNRVGDAGFIIGLLILWTQVGTFNFEDLFRQVRSPVRDERGGLTLGGEFVRGSPAETADGGPALRVRRADDAAGTQLVLFPREAPETFAAPWPHGAEEVGQEATVAVKASPDKTQFGSMPYWMMVVAGLGIFLGCVGKSAQFPLQVWLPDAMEGPTPVSALIHAATMVAAGVYLVGRCYPLFTPEALLVIAYVGGITLFVAATVAVVMTDIKKVLAYSTVSQLGYMMLALGVGGWTAGLFHLMTHAFFKALLFLCSGAVIFGCHHEQDMLQMGGLFKKMPVTAVTMLIGVLAIAGTPLFSGFYSKDAVLAAAFGFSWLHPEHLLLFLLPLVTAAITAFYMFRMWFLTFTGQPRVEHVYAHAHEAPRVMTAPLVALAVCSVCVAWGWPPWNPKESALEHLIYESQPASVTADFGRHFEDERLWQGGRLKPAERSERHFAEENHALVGNIALAAAVLGLVFAALIYYYRVLDPAESKEQFPAVHGFLTHKWYFDELYSAAVVRPALVVGEWFKWFDRVVIDGVIHAVAWTAVKVARFDGLFDNRIIDGLVNLLSRVAYGVGGGLRRLQTGYLRSYILFLVIAAVGVFIALTWLVTVVAAG
jgi:NADH-quinone oxidoreductase subunit L